MRIRIYKDNNKIVSVVQINSDKEELDLVEGKDYEVVDDNLEVSDDEYDKWASELGSGDLTLADLDPYDIANDFDWDDEDEENE